MVVVIWSRMLVELLLNCRVSVLVLLCIVLSCFLMRVSSVYLWFSLLVVIVVIMWLMSFVGIGLMLF